MHDFTSEVMFWLNAHRSHEMVYAWWCYLHSYVVEGLSVSRCVIPDDVRLGNLSAMNDVYE